MGRESLPTPFPSSQRKSLPAEPFYSFRQKWLKFKRIAANASHADSWAECRKGCLCANVCAEKGAFNAKHMCFQLLSGARPVAVTWPDKALLKYRHCGFKAVRKRTGMLFRKFFRHGQGLGCNSAGGKSDRGSS